MIKVCGDFCMWSREHFNNVLSKIKSLTVGTYIAIYSVTCGGRGMTLKLCSNDIISISLCYTLVFNELCQLSYKQQIKLTCGFCSFESCAKLMLLRGLRRMC
jgi:hypothetical protein